MTTALATIFVLGVLIFFHELGHFLVAKRAGIKVHQFSLGFPPLILKKKWGETEYCIGLIPLGGFVRMAGENPDDDMTGAPNEFMSKNVGVRAAVVAAGPIMNLILAWLILWGLFFFEGEPYSSNVIAQVGENTPAEMAGLLPGDKIIAVNDETISDYETMTAAISKYLEKPLNVVWMRDDQEMSASITTITDTVYNETGDKVPVGMIGIGVQVEYLNVGFFDAVGKGFMRSVGFVRMVVEFVYNLVTGKISPKMIGGPVFIAQLAGETAQVGFSVLLYFMALLSVNLAVLNIMPIPVLDGGHLVFLAIEKIKGSPLSMNQRSIAQQVGLVFLLLVIVLVTYNDIVRFISG